MCARILCKVHWKEWKVIESKEGFGYVDHQKVARVSWERKEGQNKLVLVTSLMGCN